jgi:hypothetical protein
LPFDLFHGEDLAADELLACVAQTKNRE